MEANKTIQITSLYNYPLKSCHENELKECIVKETGFLNDRILSIVKKSSLGFITIRENPLIYDIKCEFSQDNPNFISIKIPGSETVFTVDISLNMEEIDKGKILKVKLWDMASEAYPVETENDELNKELSKYLSNEVILIKPFTTRNWKDFKSFAKFTGLQKESDRFFFVDDAPVLVTSEESFNYINKLVIDKGDPSLKPINFRPNIILKGGEEPFWEGNVTKIKIGDVILRRVKPCTRCKITTFDFEAKKFRKSKQPLNVLADVAYDDDQEGVVFGQYFGVDLPDNYNDYKIKSGDTVIIL